MSFRIVIFDALIQEDIKEICMLALICLYCIAAAASIYALTWLLVVSSSLHWLAFSGNWCLNAI